jgi:hypothetical protein
MAKPRRAPSKTLDELGVPADAGLPKGATYAVGQRPSSVEAEVMAVFSDPVMRECLKRELSMSRSGGAGRAKAVPQ